jgi:FkbM family methyltransferase
MELFARCFRAIRYRKIVKSPRLLAILSKYRDIRKEHVAVNSAGRLILCDTNVEVDTKERRFMLQGVQLLDDLRRRAGVGVGTDRNGRVILDASAVKIIVDCWEELFIAHEILFKKIYNISLDEPFDVVDVGMNTGTSALFFASEKNCRQVDAYELFPLTVKRAEENLAINPKVSGKIRVHSFGLGSRDESLLLDYTAEFKGSIGKNGLPEYAKPQGVEVNTEKVQVSIRAAGPVLKELFELTDDTTKVLKLDCEGAEYDIIPALYEEKLLQRFSVVMVEWHLQGPSPLKQLLSAAGFTCLSFDESSGTHGMLYGFRMAKAMKDTDAAI